MKVSEFNYNLPEELIAQHPYDKRDEARLMVLDREKQKYNGLKCITLGIKSYSSTYNGNEYTKNNVLMLVECEEKFITALIYIPTSILRDYYLLGENYNYFIRTMTVISYYERYSIWFEDEERIWTTEKLKKDLEFICNNFK